MYSDKTLDAAEIPASSMRAETIAALVARKSKAETPLSDKLAKACEAYDLAHAEHLESSGSVTAARGDRNAAVAAALAGLAIMSVSTGSLVWGLALVAVLGSGALAVRHQISLHEARERCQTAIQKMYLEYRVAKKESGQNDSLPSRPDQVCP
jgi:hypothetical protein